jgi:hypothetical protein
MVIISKNGLQASANLSIDLQVARSRRWSLSCLHRSLTSWIIDSGLLKDLNPSLSSADRISRKELMAFSKMSKASSWLDSDDMFGGRDANECGNPLRVVIVENRQSARYSPSVVVDNPFASVERGKTWMALVM